MRRLLGATLIFTGIAHLTWSRKDFGAIVPDSLPLPADTVVVLSGYVEIALGVGLIALPRYRIVLGWLAAALFVAVFPANISQYLNHKTVFGLDTDAKRFARLVFQPLFVAWALWSSGAWRPRRARRSR